MTILRTTSTISTADRDAVRVANTVAEATLAAVARSFGVPMALLKAAHDVRTVIDFHAAQPSPARDMAGTMETIASDIMEISGAAKAENESHPSETDSEKAGVGSDLWTVWSGEGPCPVPDDARIVARLRGNRQTPPLRAKALIWAHYGFDSDIMGYRFATDDDRDGGW